MTEPNDSQQTLEQLIHRALRELPTRKAPRSLEMRVLNEIENRATQPIGFLHWPIAVRVAFILICLAAAKVTLDAASWGASRALKAIQLIPLDWALGTIAFAAIMYVALFSLGAVAYRTLRVPR